jgi:hypothetical protein
MDKNGLIKARTFPHSFRQISLDSFYGKNGDFFIIRAADGQSAISSGDFNNNEGLSHSVSFFECYFGGRCLVTTVNSATYLLIPDPFEWAWKEPQGGEKV